MLHPLAQDGILRLTADFDTETLLDFFIAFHDRIRDLNAVASRTRRRPCAQDDIERLDAPLAVGKVLLYRPSAGAVEWLRTCASRWWGDDQRVYTFAMAYACAHRNKDAMDALRSHTKASLLVWAWAIRCAASEEALRRAALALMPPPDDSIAWFADPDTPPPTAPDLMDTALALSKEYDGTTTHWIYEVSDDDFWAAVCNINDTAELAKKDPLTNPDSWMYRHRKALCDCETALEQALEGWLAKRQPAQEESTEAAADVTEEEAPPATEEEPAHV